MRGGVEAGVVHRRRRRNPLRPAVGHEVHRLAGHWLPEREVGELELGEQFPEGPRIDDRAGEIVLAQAFGLLEHADVHIRHTAASFLIALHQAGQLDGARQPRRPRAHDQHVHLDRLGTGSVAKDQAIERQRGLVAGRQDGRHEHAILGDRGSPFKGGGNIRAERARQRYAPSSRAQARGLVKEWFEPFPGQVPRCARDHGAAPPSVTSPSLRPLRPPYPIA